MFNFNDEQNTGVEKSKAILTVDQTDHSPWQEEGQNEESNLYFKLGKAFQQNHVNHERHSNNDGIENLQLH